METQELKPKRNVLFEAGLTFTIAAFLSLLVPGVVLMICTAAAGSDATGEDWYKYLNFLLPQVCFAAAALLFFKRSGVSPRKVYAPCKWRYFTVALLLEFGLLFSLSELNGLFSEGLKRIGYQSMFADDDVLPSLGGWNLLPALLTIAVLPALFEETVFRGILAGSGREGGWGTLPAVLITGALFSLFHGNPEQTVYQFVCGACYALLFLRSGSVFPTMLAHFLNNAVILILSSCGVGNLFQSLPLWGYILTVVLSGVCFLLAMGFLAVFERKKRVKGGAPQAGKFFIAASVGIGICAFEWIASLIMGIAGLPS